MAIRFVNDAAAVVIPPNQSSRKYGQQLVLQQQKYANDQRQLQQEQMYDRQKQFTQNAMQLQREQERRNQLGQQALADLNAKQVFGAQQADAAKIAQKQKEKQAAEKAEKENLARLKAQERADDEEAIKFGGYDPVTASELRKSYALDTKIDLNPDYDEAMRADAHRQNQENRRKLQESRIATPSMADRANQNLSYYVPSLQRYAKPEELQGLKQADPNIEVQVFQDGKMLPGPTPKQAPMSAQDYYRADSGMFKKDLAGKMSELQGKLDAGEMTLGEGQDLRSVAWQQMQDDYNFAQQALGMNQPVQGGSAMPPQAGQPAAPPAQAQAAQPPAMGMQDLEPTYNADGTTSVPGQPPPPKMGLGALLDMDALPVEGPKEEADRSFVDENGIKWKRVPSELYHGQYTPDTPPKEGMVVTWPGGIRHKWSQNGWIALGKASEAAPGAQAPSPPQNTEPDAKEQNFADKIQERSNPKYYHNDGRVFQQAPDGSGWREVKDVAKQPIQQADGVWVQQSPEDGAWRPISPPGQGQPAATGQPAMPPARPLQPGEEEGGSSFAPRAPGIQQQPVETLPVDQTGMQPPQQNAWAELATPEQQTLEQKPADIAISEKEQAAPVETPDFAKLLESSTDEADRALYGELRSIYDKLVEATGTPQSLEIQNAIGVVVDQKSNPELAAQAYLYLKSQGIDLSKLSKPKKRQLSGMSGIR